MPRRSHDLHGNAPHESRQALLLIDTINDLEWEGAAPLRPKAALVAKALARLKERARVAGVPTIYVNDNFGQWRSDFNAQVDHCLASQHGRSMAQLLKPAPNDYYILKAKHSGFYGSPLHILLEHIGAKELILGGFTTHSCVLFTAVDAFLRDYQLIIPSDGVASCNKKDHERALLQMQSSLSAKVVLSSRIRLKKE
ncbi:MAG TPA: isochorismatase family cysteine hydrolase [Oligoflexus sp.]|uniref:isochorismatase family cysteine hydrolase n=1 Tax=Oligoflexus sp. TaxID=1971216 RepID=UPI002D563A93|nr:isochorismatase family cysteine hydrolase [Oligoflexus sp.]HYX38660.1 isochorismatase family cysteine hydrolase [Oligoflexus sp.]